MPRPAWIAFACIVATGCAKPPEGPAVLTIEPALYQRAFDAALAASRDNDMPPTMRDRRLGIIDTEPSIAGSILEPWRPGNASLEQAWENTLDFQRRRARFEFTPAAFREPQDNGVPDLLGVGVVPPDLTAYDGPVELRVSVVVERAFTPGIRRNTWSSTATTHAVIRRPATNPSKPVAPFWTPVTRDTAFERRLLAEVAHAIASE